MHCTVKLALRQGRYRYEVTDFVFEYSKAKSAPTRLPAEDDLIRTRAINEDGDQMLTAERQCFAAAAAELQAQLKEKMNTPVVMPEAKQ